MAMGNAHAPWSRVTGHPVDIDILRNAIAVRRFGGGMPREIRARQRVSQACVPCGQRKTKCDGSLPACNQCIDSSRNCHYGISKRNKTRRSSIILANRSHTVATEPVADKNAEQTDSSAPASSSGWVANEDESRSLQSGVHSSRRPSNQQDIAVSADMSAQLFTAYFANIHPIWPILYMPMHDYGNSNLHADAFAPAVLYAVYAIASCVVPASAAASTASEGNSPTSAVFFEAALLALQKKEDGRSRTSSMFHPLNFISPSIESCQTLVILALQQHGLGEASNAAMLCNTAAGMAIELRLNEARPPDADYITTQIASRLWWNLYVLDKVLACGLGRPVTLRSEDATTQYPSEAESDEYQLLLFRKPGSNEVVRIKSHTISGFNLTIELCFILEDILRTTCSVTSKQRICKDLTTAEEKRMSIWTKLQSCNEAVKSSTIGVGDRGSFRSVVPPVAIIYAAWIYAATILLHRPFHLYWRENNWSPPHGLSPQNQPIQVCLNAAQDLCAVLSAYVDDLTRLPCDVIFPIVLAAATLWQHRKDFAAGYDRTKVQQQIDLCVKCLAIVGKFWKNAGDCRRKLIHDFAGAASTPTPTVNDMPYRQNLHSSYDGRAVAQDAAPSHMMEDVTSATMPSIEENCGLAPAAVETTYPFLDALGSRLDEFTTADEGFRAYLEEQLGQYDFPAF